MVFQNIENYFQYDCFLEKLQCDRVGLLLNGHPWKKKDVRNENKDKQCIGAVESLRELS